MKKVIWVLIAVLVLGALNLLPFRSRELADLLPVKTVIVTRSGKEYTVDVGAGVKAVGDTLSDALKRLQEQIRELREKLQMREKELLAERQRNEELSRAEATRQQVLLARLAALESPSIGTSQSLETNQSREARKVKLPSWMRLGK